MWKLYAPGRQSIMAARYSLDGWSTPATLLQTQVPDTESTFPEPAQVRALFNAFGQPCAAFIQRDDQQHADVWASCHTGWSIWAVLLMAAWHRPVNQWWRGLTGSSGLTVSSADAHDA